jgi:hypothetical protein
MTKMRGAELAVAWVIFLPLGVALNAVFLWGVRDMLPRTPIEIAIDALWFTGLYLLYRRYLRTSLNEPRDRATNG